MNQYNFRWNFLGAMNRVLWKYWRPDYQTAVEWGSGYSTFVFDTLAASGVLRSFISVEQYEPYLNEVLKHIDSNGPYKPVLAELFDSDRLGSDSDKMLYYTTSPLQAGSPIDFALIDGRARAECLFVAALASSGNATFLLDDSERIRYSASLAMFDKVDHQLRFAVLKFKPQLKSLFSRFRQRLEAYQDQPVASPREGRAGGMGHVPEIPPMSETEHTDLDRLLKDCGNYQMQTVCWSDDDVARVVEENAPGSTISVLQITDANASETEPNTQRVRQRVSLTGSLNDLSKDPNLHYSTAILADSTRFSQAVVAGHRRNECLLSLAYVIGNEGVVFVRDGECASLAPGLSLYQKIDQRGSWIVVQPREDVNQAFTELLPQLRERTLGAEVSLL